MTTYNPVTPLTCDCAKKLIKDCIRSNLPGIGCATDIPKCLLDKIPAVAGANTVAGCGSALGSLADSCHVSIRLLRLVPQDSKFSSLSLLIGSNTSHECIAFQRRSSSGSARSCAASVAWGTADAAFACIDGFGGPATLPYSILR